MAVYQYQTKKGKRWRVQRTITNDGLRKTICKRGFISEKSAKDYDIDLAYTLKQNTYTNNDVTLDYVFEDYLIDKKKEVELLWFNKIKQIYADYIGVYYGDKKINTISTRDIIKWKRIINDFGFSISYKQKIFIIFNAIFKHAMLCFGLQENVLLKVGNFKEIKRDGKHNIIIWQESDIPKFLQSFDDGIDSVYHAFFATEIYTGMRNCEAFALTWYDIDFEKRTITINKSLTQNVKGTRAYIGKTKTASSNRIIDMPQELYTILLTRFNEVQLLDGYTMNWYVFGSHKPIAETTMNKKRIMYCKKANVPIISCHKIRHTHISHLIANGANPLAVAKRVGHSSTKMTLDIYGHSINKSDDELLDIISNVYSKKVSNNEE